MASFDVIDAAMQGYRQIWAERRYLMRLALIPILVKFVCTVTVMALGVEQNFLRQALLFLPAYFTEGWLLSHVVRLQFLGQRWPFRPTGDNAADEIVLRDRFRGVMGGTIVYALTRFLFAGALQLMQKAQEGMVGAQTAQVVTGPMMGAAVAMLVLFVMFLWAFRLMWLFIPVALNVPAAGCVRAVGRGMMPSIYMIGAWLICFVPLIFLFQIVGSFMLGMAGGMTPPLEFSLTFVQVVIEAASMIMTTIAIATGMAQMMNPPAAKVPPRRRK